MSEHTPTSRFLAGQCLAGPGALLGLAAGWVAEALAADEGSGVVAAWSRAQAEGWVEHGLWRLVARELAPPLEALALVVLSGAALGLVLGLLWPRGVGAGAWRLAGRILALVLVVPACLVALGSVRWGTSPTPDGPNVVWICIDALRADHLGCYGHPLNTSPYIDSLAKQGVRFETALSQESYTMASVASYFTSASPRETGVLYDKPAIDTLDPGFVTVAEVLSHAGWDTAAFVFNPHLQARFNFDQGFDVYDDTVPQTDMEGNFVGDEPFGLPCYQGWETARKMEFKLRRYFEDQGHAESGRPKFLYLHYRDVHGPYIPPPPFHRMFVPDTWGPGKLAKLEELTNRPVEPEQEHPGWPWQSRENMREFGLSQYDGELRYTDESLRRLMPMLEDWGVPLDDTILVISADHGEEFYDEHPGDKGGWSHGRTIYGEQIEVPLIVRLPGGGEGRVVSTPVELMDVAPTLVDLVGLPATARAMFSGRSLAPAILGGELREQPVFSGGNHGRGVVYGQGHSLYRYDEVTKFVERYYAHRPEADQEVRPGVELYAFPEDRTQSVDLTADHPEVIQRLSTTLFDWLAQGSGEARGTAELDPETYAELKALGYLGEDN